MSIIKDNCCDDKIVWKPIKLQLNSGMKSIKLIESNEIIIPKYLDKPIPNYFKQWQVEISFDDSFDDIEDAINIMQETDFNWETFEDTINVCYAGAIFKRRGYHGYWILKEPCVECVDKLADLYGDDSQILEDTYLKRTCDIFRRFLFF